MLILAGGKELPLKTDIDGFSALHWAAQSGHAGIAKYLVEEGGKELVLILANGGLSALHIAAQLGHEATVRLLIKAGGEDLLLVTDTHGTALCAAGGGHVVADWGWRAEAVFPY